MLQSVFQKSTIYYMKNKEARKTLLIHQRHTLSLRMMELSSLIHFYSAIRMYFLALTLLKTMEVLLLKTSFRRSKRTIIQWIPCSLFLEPAILATLVALFAALGAGTTFILVSIHSSMSVLGLLLDSI